MVDASLGWQREAEDCATGRVWLSPYLTAMGLDDGAAHGQADPHSVLLGRMKRIEQSL